MIKYFYNEVEDRLDVKLEGDFDIEGTEVVEEELIPTMLNYKTVNIDFENVPFVDSSGMGLLIDIVKTLNDKGIKVTISKVRQEVFEVFEIIQLPEILGEEVFV
ncbi:MULTISPECIES: STAS domain-containing protein [Bacillus]|jgi:anti-anti-sigma factor|uniref:STAS domain-containing protein n=1 Tax=Bacillus TaxID=1386 RepID=UPI00065DFBC4|nr:STAS domain-containing protein [Bacillus smithii]AKP48514.1 Anti-sigmaB factor antagonist [Bacillus smithii]MED0658419.1 STAS domain-containing protein [Bacillus smithii]MED1420481.1 STAS domain-containing protein [Bacillus smithii]MED1456821.1 STAS domain-containing protein [Bacillus smithii]MED1489852.1 STAS domain-containing protein [Bacillus smithii]